jgi:membrane-associated two-gene conflict system component 1 (EACC1)
MQVEIRAADEDGAGALRDFFRWLRDDEEGPDDVALTHDATGHPGAMGALEVVQVVLAQSTALAGLAMQYASWRRSRSGTRGGAAFTFTRPSDGVTVTVEGGTDDDVRRALAVLAAPPATPPAPGDGSAAGSR